MRKERVFFSNIGLGRVEIKDKKISHKLKVVLRKNAGSSILVFDGKGREYSAVIESITSRKLTVNIINLVRQQPQKLPLAGLAFSLVKSLKTELLLKMCTEIGIDVFIPFISKNCVVSLKDFIRKKRRFEEIVLQASIQSRRLYVPKIMPISDFSGLLKQVSGYDLCLLADPYSRNNLGVLAGYKDIVKNSLLAIVGPEGGLTETEVLALKEAGARAVKISDFILRAETAAAVISALAIAGFRQ